MLYGLSDSLTNDSSSVCGGEERINMTESNILHLSLSRLSLIFAW
jgi:hypothetical protein